MSASARQQRWSRAVRKRDNYTCQLCLSHENLTAHHLDSRDIKIRFNKDNGICLCENCHVRFHKSHMSVCNGKQQPCTADDFDRFRVRVTEKLCTKQGRSAYTNDLTRADNPYGSTTLAQYLLWERGFKSVQVKDNKQYLSEF